MTRLFKVSVLFIFTITNYVMAQNPFIRDQFSADPSARVFDDRVYVYPSHDILAKEGKGRVGWFCMEDYHVFSSENLTDWTDHGVIVKQNEVPWVKKNSYAMWAPDCIYKNGKYYFYFPATPADTTGKKRFTIGVAVSDNPTGPFTPQAEAIKNVRGIDPNVFIDKDGQSYLYWSQQNIYGAKLKNDMLELAMEPKTLGELPTKGLKEGPFMFERNGIYYLTYPHVENKIERLEYATGDNPLGPFKFAGVIMDESPIGCWTNHHSIIQIKNQWFLFYHHNDYSPKFDKARSVRIDSLFFNPDGSIKKVTPTFRGVGITDGRQNIQLDRYTQIDDKGASIAFVDSLHTFLGWKTVLKAPGAWVKYNAVDLGKGLIKKISVRAISNGGILQVRTDGLNGTVVAEMKIPASKDWTVTKATLLKVKSGVRNIVVVLKGSGRIEVNWISFE
ncbi:MAG TPA: family 43 glycosylhydrolase [Cyclobacteriaceae bacterium]|jgi:hypothetical protein|nr:family 43 glycosylhydrolase [Cyclobacteriaceae bacterium]